jgi:hypothetical protein
MCGASRVFSHGMFREFSIRQVKAEATRWEYPLTADELYESPFAGALATEQLELALGRFPFGRRAPEGWRFTAPGRGQLSVTFTNDGSLLLRGHTSLQLVYGLFVHLLEVQAELVLEDRITGVLHNRASLLYLVRREEQRESADHHSPAGA